MSSRLIPTAAMWSAVIRRRHGCDHGGGLQRGLCRRPAAGLPYDESECAVSGVCFPGGLQFKSVSELVAAMTAEQTRPDEQHLVDDGRAFDQRWHGAF